MIVAFAVLALALTLLLGTLSGAARQVRWADDAGRAALHAQSLLDQLGVGEALQPGQRDGEFEDGRYRWSLEVAPWRDPLLPPAVATDRSGRAAAAAADRCWCSGARAVRASACSCSRCGW